MSPDTSVLQIEKSAHEPGDIVDFSIITLGDRRERDVAVLAKQRSTFPFLRSVVLALLGALLTWQVLVHSLVAHLAEASPETALRLRSDDPAALVNVSDRKLNLEHPTKEAPAALPGGDTGNRIPSFARRARKAAAGEAEPAEGAAGQAKDPAETTERLPNDYLPPVQRLGISVLEGQWN